MPAPTFRWYWSRNGNCIHAEVDGSMRTLCGIDMSADSFIMAYYNNTVAIVPEKVPPTWLCKKCRKAAGNKLRWIVKGLLE